MAARVAQKRASFDVIHHRDAGCVIDIMDHRRNPRLRCDTQRDILVWIAQRTWVSLDPQQIAPPANPDFECRCARSPAGNSRDCAGASGAEAGNQRGADGLALQSRKPVETVFAHDRCLHYLSRRRSDFSEGVDRAINRRAHPLKLRNTKQAPPARRMRLQRSSAAGRVSAPIRT